MPGSRQHITPVHHLAQFTGKHPEGCVWVYDRDEDTTRPTAPESTGFEHHFYSLKRDDGSWDTRLDEWITGVEAKAHPIYQELLRGVLPVDDTQEKADFAVYLSTIWGRTKATRRFVAEVYASHMQMLNHATAAHEEAFDAHIRRLEKEFGHAVDPKTREEVRKAMLDPSDWIIEVPKQRTLKGLRVIDKLTDLFFQMRWSLCFAKKGFFITSDNPLTRRVDPKTRHRIYGDHGFLNKTAQVTLALSPKIALMLTWQKDTPRYFPVSEQSVKNLNHDLAAHAERYLYCHLKHKHVQKLSRKFAGKKQSYLQGLGDGHYAEVRITRK
jgi:hypothetical protein